MLAEDESHSIDQTSPGAFAALIGHTFAARNGQNEQKERKRSQGIEDIDHGKTGMDNKKTTDGRTDNRSDLENAVVPGDGVGERVARHEVRKKRAASSPTEGAHRSVNEEQKIDQRNRSVIKVKRRLMSLKNCRYSAEAT